MTTLDVNMGQLRTAVAPYPIVKDLQVSTQFPHGMRIGVVEQLPVGRSSRAVRPSRSAATGRCCTMSPAGSLPAIPLSSLPGARRQPTRGAERARAARGGAVPAPGADQPGHATAAHGLVAQLRSGPSIYFGDDSRSRRQVGCGHGGARRSELRRGDLHRRHRPGAPAAGVSEAAVAAAGLITVGSSSAAEPDGASTTASDGASTVGSNSASTAGSSGAPASSNWSGHPNPQLELYPPKSRTLGRRSRVPAFCNSACVAAFGVDFPQLQGHNVRNSRYERLISKHSTLTQGSDGHQWKAAVISQSSKSSASAAAAPTRSTAWSTPACAGSSSSPATPTPRRSRCATPTSS